jgi:hypothetical protein
MKKLLALAVISAGFAFAGNPNTGCGLGYMLFQNNQNTVLTQVLAVTTNGISGNQTFGITSGTLGCQKPAKFASNDKLNNFVRDNLDQIAMDAARGNGETIKTLAKLMHVKNEKLFAQRIQSNFDKIFTNANVTYSQVIDNIATYAL